jgi:hypothetical protein
MTRQKLAKTKPDNEKPKTTKSLGARYAELLRLREAVSRSQSDSQISSNVEQSLSRGDRA